MGAIGKIMQKVSMSTPGRSKAFLSKMKPDFFEKKGFVQALDTFQISVKSVPAYKKFLKSKGFDLKNIESIKTKKDFKKVPFIDKDEYIKQYPLKERVLGGNLDSMYAMSSSSGSTGTPTYWPRTIASDEIVPKAIDMLICDILFPKKLSTLAVNTLSMGLWSAGDLALLGLRALAAKKDYKITVASPGLRFDDTFSIIKNLGEEYDQVFLIGYPPFIKDLIVLGEKEGIDWKKLSVKIMMGGEGISEVWRDFILKKIGSENVYDVSNLFATADAGIVGFETPFSIIVRRLAQKNKKLKELLFGGEKDVSVVQFNPMGRYMEEVNGEILITGMAGVPLIRYNIHDRGKVISYKTILTKLEETGVDIEKEMQDNGFDFAETFRLPFMVAHGRSDAVHFYAVNIYRENVMHSLDKKDIQEKVSGKFNLSIVEDKKANQILKLKIELSKGQKISSDLADKITRSIHQSISDQNNEYKELSKYLSKKEGKDFYPDVELFLYGENKSFTEYKIKQKYTN